MERFAALVDALIYTRGRNGKLALIADYLRATPDPDRGWALAALTGGLDFPAVKPATIRGLLMERVDPVLFALSRDFVGDTAETASLMWPAPESDVTPPPTLSEVVDLLGRMTRVSVMSELPRRNAHAHAPGRHLEQRVAAVRVETVEQARQLAHHRHARHPVSYTHLPSPRD